MLNLGITSAIRIDKSKSLVKVVAGSLSEEIYNSQKVDLLKSYHLMREEVHFKKIMYENFYTKSTGIGLTKSSDSDDDLFEAVNLEDLHGNYVGSANSKNISSSEFNYLGKKREVVWNSVANNFFLHLTHLFKTPVLKARIISLDPGSKILKHIDRPLSKEIRIHSLLETNDKCFWQVDNQILSLPIDNRFYFFDTSLPHSVVNLGKTRRTILTVCFDSSKLFSKFECEQKMIRSILNEQLL